MLVHKMRALIAAFAIASLFVTASANAGAPDDVPLGVTVLQKPAPMLAAGKGYLVYELWLTNFQRGAAVHIDKIEVSDTARQLASFGPDKLKEMIKSLAGDSPDPAALAPGATAVVYVWIELTALGALDEHRLDNTITVSGLDQRYLSHALPVPIEIDRGTPIPISAPLRGEHWIAFNGPSNTSVHRRTFLVQSGRPWFAQRYALDLVQVDSDGRSFKGDREKNASYLCYGADVMAVADGVVANAHDGIAENVPNDRGERAVPMTIETAMGNYVVIDIGHGFYAGYAHMIPGSITVKTGDKVHRGQVIGKLGNSGNSTEPHLHFQVTNGPRFIGADGVPYGFLNIEVYPKPAEDAGDHLKLDLSSTPEGRHGELVLENAVINFPLDRGHLNARREGTESKPSAARLATLGSR